MKQLLYFLGLLISLSGFLIAIYTAIRDQAINDPNNIQSDLEESAHLRLLNSYSIICIFIGFLFIHLGHFLTKY